MTPDGAANLAALPPACKLLRRGSSGTLWGLVSESAQPTPQPSGPPPSGLARYAPAVTELLLLAVSFLTGIVVVTVLMFAGLLPDATKAAWSGIVAGPILLGSAGLTYFGIERSLARSGDPVRPLVERKARKGVGASVIVAFSCVGLAIMGSMLIGFVQQFVIEVEEQKTIVELVERGDPLEITLLALTAVVLAPIAEEFLFRHMLFRRLHQRTALWLVWLLPAVAFAVSHWNPPGLLVYTWLGLVFAYAYLNTGRLWVAMLVHAGHNAFALAMLLWLPKDLPMP